MPSAPDTDHNPHARRHTTPPPPPRAAHGASPAALATWENFAPKSSILVYGPEMSLAPRGHVIFHRRSLPKFWSHAQGVGFPEPSPSTGREPRHSGGDRRSAHRSIFDLKMPKGSSQRYGRARHGQRDLSFLNTPLIAGDNEARVWLNLAWSQTNTRENHETRP